MNVSQDAWIYEANTESDGIPWHMFVLLDGHQGSKCAEYVRKTLWHELLQMLPTTEPSDWETEGRLTTQSLHGYIAFN